MAPRDFCPRAVAVGFMSDVLLTKLFILGLMVVLIDPGSSSQSLIERIRPEFLERFCTAWGIFFTGLGGFIAGRLNPRLSLGSGLLVGVLSLAASVLFFDWNLQSVSPDCFYAGVFLTLPAAVAGSRLARCC